MSRAKYLQLLHLAKAISDKDLTDLALKQTELDRTRGIRAAFAEQIETEDRKMVSNMEYRRTSEEQRRMWRTREQYALTHYEARAAALVETQKRIAAKSFGRVMVLEKLKQRWK